MTDKPRLPPFGTQDFLDRTPAEQNILRALYNHIKATDTLISLPGIATTSPTDLATAIARLNELSGLLQQMIETFQNVKV